jgi:hypothetical protein
LTNYHCQAQDFYVDGHLAASVASGATTIFKTTPGQHSIFTCLPGTSTCGAKIQVDWTTSTTQSISRGSDCP